MLVSPEIIQSVKEGSARAFEQLYQAYVDRVYRFLFSLLHSSDDAREAAQDVFVKLWDNRQQLQPDADVAPYLFKICKNHALNILRKRKYETRMIQHYPWPQPLPATDEADDSPYAALLKEAIDTLPPRRKYIFELCKIQGMSYKQVAQLLQISDGTVEVQVTKALKQIRAHVGNSSPGAIAALLYFVTYS